MLSLKYSVRAQYKSHRQILKIAGLLCFLFLVAPLLSACSFQPLYGSTANGGSLSQVMKTVDIVSIPGRVGQKLRNELIFKATGGGESLQPVYRLEVAVRESVKSILVQRTGDAQGRIYSLGTKFKLVRIKDNVVVFEGSARARAPFDKFESSFANTRARIDAEARAARTAADTIRTRVATYLSRTA